MSQFKQVFTDDFTLRSTWSCVYMDGAWVINKTNNSDVPGTVTKNVTFEWEPLGNVEIKSAKIHATLGTPFTGAETRTVNGVSFDSEGFADVAIDSNATSFLATFKFKAIGIPFEDTEMHYSDQSYKDVYLLIEYEYLYTPPELVDYTDSDPVQGETYVKAVHMTELHTNVNLVRVARKLAECEFTSIVAMETSLAGWNDNVLEIRSAVDEMAITHEDWIELGENYPRLDVLLQLRRVVQAVSEA